MKVLGIYLLLLVIGVGIAASDVPVIRWEEKAITPVAVDTGAVRKLNDSAVRNAEDGSFAALAGKPGVVYEWVPSADDSRITKGAMLLDAALASDGSAVVLLERLGEKGGPFGSRIVVFDLLGHAVVAVPAFLENEFVRVAPTEKEGTAAFFALERRKSGVRVVLWDLAAGSMVAESEVFPGKGGALLLRGDHVYLLPDGAAELLIWEHGDLMQAPLRVALKRAGGLLFAGGDGVSFAQATVGRVDFFRLQEGEAVYEKTVALRKDFIPVFGAMAGELDQGILLGDGEGCEWIVFPAGGRELELQSGRAAVWMPDEKRFLVNLLRNDAVAFCSASMTPEVDRPVDVGRLKPATNGDVRWLFPADTQERSIWVVDHRSGIFRIDMQGRRWKKAILRHAP